MPKNIKGGNKAKKGKNSSLREFTRRLELPDDSGYQFYGLVLKHYGATTDIMFFDTRKNKDEDASGKLTKAIGYIRGSIKKRCRPKVNDIVIIAVRDYQNNKVDIIHKYNEDEMKRT
jgi:translation initiation factor 1A